MVSPGTPISLPTLAAHVLLVDGSYGTDSDSGGTADSLVPVLDDGGGRVDDGTVHVEEESIEGDSYRPLRVLRLRTHVAGDVGSDARSVRSRLSTWRGVWIYVYLNSCKSWFMCNFRVEVRLVVRGDVVTRFSYGGGTGTKWESVTMGCALSTTE